MAAGICDILNWLAGSEAILRAESAFLSASTAAGGDDRISALHDHLLRDIVSRLPARDAARTAALASRWRHLWRSTPLVFHDPHLLPSRQPELAAAVARVLAAHPGPFATVSIRCCDFRRQSLQLAECPRLLAAKGVRDLILVNNMAADGDHLPDAPAEVLSCASLRRLYLGYFRFPDTGAGPPGREQGLFPHLRELTLLGVHMPDCGNLDQLLARSPVLDTLLVVLSRIFHHIHLCSQSLKSALLWSYYAQEIAVMDCPLLESLILCDVSFGEGDSVAVKIAAAPKLRVLGYLEPRVHQLKIGDNLIKPDTKPSPSTVVPSVKILALKVNFGVLKEVKMLASFLRCFPNIEMLHIESLPANERTRKHNAKFWRELCPIECLKSHVTEMIVHEFRGDRSEMEFLKFVDRSANEMLYLLVRTTAEIFASADEMDELMTKMEDFTHRGWVCDHSIVVVGEPLEENLWSFSKASDLSADNPFQCWS